MEYPFFTRIEFKQSGLQKIILLLTTKHNENLFVLPTDSKIEKYLFDFPRTHVCMIPPSVKNICYTTDYLIFLEP